MTIGPPSFFLHVITAFIGAPPSCSMASRRASLHGITAFQRRITKLLPRWHHGVHQRITITTAFISASPSSRRS
jgi:hypothetical protein